MDRNFDFRGFDRSSGRNRKGEGEPSNPPFFANKISRNDDDLIIDETSVYEIDQECYERSKRAKLNQRKEFGNRI